MQYYHTHTSYSNLYASFKDSHMLYGDYAKRAKEVGARVLSSVEHGFQGNHGQCYLTAEKENLKFVFGTEAYWVRDRTESDRTNAHIVVLARNINGVYAINEALSEANCTGFYAVPRLDMEILRTLPPDDVFVTTACVAFWGKVDKATNKVLWHYGGEENDMREQRKLFLSLYEHFGNSLRLEVQAHNTPWQKEVNRLCLDLHYQYNIPLIAGTDSHYVYPEQAQERRNLREESGTAHMDEHELDSGVYEDYPDEATFRRRMEEQGVLNLDEIQESIASTEELLSFDDICYDTSRKLPTIYPALTQEERDTLLEKRVWNRWDEYKKDVPEARRQEYEDGIRYELDTITSTHTSDYFLFNSRMIERGKELGGYLTPTGRGSAGSFFLNTLLGMSTLDRFALPIRMYPQRFVTAERLKSSLPDIDFNVADPAPFVQAQQELLGEGHVFPMVSYGTLKTKSAFRLYARVVGMDIDKVNTITRQLAAYEQAVASAEEDERDTISLDDFVSSENKEMVEASETYRGIIVSKAQAPCGYLLYNGDIRREIGIIRINGKGGKQISYCTVFDGTTAEKLGYVKNDILTVAVISVNHRAMMRAGIGGLTSQDIIRMTDRDDATWNLLAKHYTQGINQCQRDATADKVAIYKPRCLQDFAAVIAAVRPGFKSQVDGFLHRRKYSYGIPPFDALLQNDTSGSSWMLYQENIMAVLQLAGFTLEETYPIIKAISKKKEAVINSAKERFLEGFTSYLNASEGKASGKNRDSAEAVWKVIADNAQYGFNSAHAAAMAIDALYGLYLKAHYPHEYYAELLEDYSKKGNKKRIALIKEEMKNAFGIRVVPCRFREDNRRFAYDKTANTMMDTLPSIKNISAACAETLYKMRDEQFETATDLFVALSNQPALTSMKIETLIRLGYFAEFGSTRKLLMLYDEFRNGTNAYKKTYVAATKQRRLEALRQFEASLSDIERDPRELISDEAAYLGVPLSQYPDKRREYVVVSVEPKRSILVGLYGLASGRTGTVKVAKSTFDLDKFKVGDVLMERNFHKRPLYTYENGVRTQVPGKTEIWLDEYEVVYRRDIEVDRYDGG